MAGNSSDEAAQRRALSDNYRKLGALGLNELASGNISCRAEGGMLISASGATAEDIQAADLVKMSLDGVVEGNGKPSSEWQMHAAIYQRYDDTNSVVHTHSDYCVAIASQVQTLPGFHYLVGEFGGNDVPCTPYYTFGTVALAQAAVEALSERSACLLGNHGMISRAENLERAVYLAQRLEITARQYVLSRQMGEPKTLSELEWKEFFEQFGKLSYGH